ncbi:MAG: alpha/beta hydrolase [Candidatus Wildermuthbacteria bacterium]|nr:alpha/beta hydrolase [Candidatus Wildermuthbacteria bacterium]
MNPILILHGWGWPVSSTQGTRVKELLEGAGYAVFLPDLPGFGQAPPPTEPWTIDDFVEWAKDFCEKNNLSRIFLLGHSFGGSVAAKFSIKYPTYVQKLILVDSAGIRKKRLKKEIQKKVAHFLNKFSFLPFYGLIRKIAYRTLFRYSDYLLTDGVMKETYLKTLENDISGVFSGVSVPTLLVWGEKDKITPLEHAYFIKENIPGAKLEIIPGVRHNPHREAPEKLVEIITQFLRS